MSTQGRSGRRVREARPALLSSGLTTADEPPGPVGHRLGYLGQSLGTGLFRSSRWGGVPLLRAMLATMLGAFMLLSCLANPPTAGNRLAMGPSGTYGSTDEVLALVVVNQRSGEELLRATVRSGDTLEFGWIHSVELFPWIEFFTVRQGGGLLLREMRVRGFGAGVPHDRSSKVRTENGWIISSDIDEPVDRYPWINSHTAVGQVRLNGMLLFSGSDFPHHEALELRVEAWRTP
jgi:hypothetical protein